MSTPSPLQIAVVCLGPSGRTGVEASQRVHTLFVTGSFLSKAEENEVAA
jgi:hypothetical protein